MALVESLQVDHRLAAVAALAVHMLEQMQRQRARAVEQQDVAFLQVVEIAGGDFLEDPIEAIAVARGRRASRSRARRISGTAACSSAEG